MDTRKRNLDPERIAAVEVAIVREKGLPRPTQATLEQATLFVAMLTAALDSVPIRVAEVSTPSP